MAEMVPIPDPTTMTTEQLMRALKSEREYTDGKIEVLQERLRGMDRAAEIQLAASSKAIDKAERVTAETIKTNQELGSNKTDALAKALDEMNLRVTRMESLKAGGREQLAGVYALAGFILTLLVIGGVIAANGGLGK